jgi:uncharacterized protein YggU (UPF0235/DUF167 family)
MKIIVRLKMNSEKSGVESFGDNRYLVKMMSAPEDEDAQEEFFALMTRKMGVPRTRFEFMGKDANGDRIFEIR